MPNIFITVHRIELKFSGYLNGLESYLWTKFGAKNLVIEIFMEIQASGPDSQKKDCNSGLEGYEREFFWILTSLAMLYA